MVASLQHEMIPPHLNLSKLNPKINLNAIPARIPLEPTPWPRKPNKPRLAGVSSFGITGTDGHLIIQETPEIHSRDTFSLAKYFNFDDRPLHIMKLSAKTDEALDAIIRQYQHYLAKEKNGSFPNICYTANVGRATFSHRAVVIAKNCEDACKLLEAKKYLRNTAPSENPGKICFLFTGQGSQYVGMAKQLYDSCPLFRMNLDKCHKILHNKFGLNIKASLWGSNAGFELTRSLYSQTGIFCVEYSLLKLWESWGIKPDLVIGHSLGEFCAAVAAGMLSLEDALTLVSERSRLVEALPKGKMLVLRADKTTVDEALNEYTEKTPGFWLDYAAVNSKEQTVLAGQSQDVESFAQFCTLSKNIKSIILEASHAFHSRMMDPILKDYTKVVGSINKKNAGNSSACKFISGVYGKLMNRTDLLSPKYWVDHTREKVNFIDACKTAETEECKYFIEIGPQPVLSALVVANTVNQMAPLCVPSIRRNEENLKTMLASLGKLYLNGWSVDWKGFDKYYQRSKLHTLPTYPFQRKKYWFDITNVNSYGGNLNNDFIHPLLGSTIPNASTAKIFQSVIDVRKRALWIKDHCVGKRILFPGAGLLEMCLSAGHCVTEGIADTFFKPSGPLTIENLKILLPLALDEKHVCQLQTVVHNNAEDQSTGEKQDGMKIQIFQQHLLDGEAPKWTEHCVSYFSPASVDFDEISFRDAYNFEKISQQCQSKIDISQLYGKLAEVGLKFGPCFQSMVSISAGQNGVLVEAKASDDEKDYIVHPVLLDSMLQAAMVAKSKGDIKNLHVPISIKKFTWLQHPEPSKPNGVSNKSFIYACANHHTDKHGDFNPGEFMSVLFSGNPETGYKIIGFMSGMEFAETSISAIESHLDSQKIDLPTLHNEVWKANLGPNQSRVNIWDIAKEEVLDEDVEELFKESNIGSDNDLKREALLQKLCYGYIVSAYQELCWKLKVGDTFHLDDFMQECQIAPQFKKLVRYFMTLLVDEGILNFTGEYEWSVLKPLPSTLEARQLIQNTKNSLQQFDNLWNSIQIYTSCGKNYAKILQGKSSALSILFPQDSDQPSAESFYTESYAYSGMANYTVNHFKKLLRPYDPSNKSILRILEVGAGTGNFTRDILRIFREHGIGIEYTFTDISPAFFINAAKKFEDFKDIIKYQVFNVEHDAKQQGFSPEYYDLIVGADVIHATKSMADSISNVRQLLRPGGLLCLIEAARANHITCIFGLLEGYWRYVDTDIRQHHPLVPGETWKNVCLNQGFDKAVTIPCILDYYAFILARRSIDEPSVPRPITYFKGAKWLVFPTLDNESKHLINKLSIYRPVITVWKSKNYYESEDGTGFGINVNKRDHLSKMMQAVRNQSSTSYIEGIVYLWSLSAGTNADQAEIAQPFLNVCQAVVEMKQQQTPKFLAVTIGTYSIGDHPCDNPSASTIWGIAKSCANEMNIKIKMIDVCPMSQSGLDNAENIFYELWTENTELYIAYREQSRCYVRLMKTKITEKPLKLPQSDRFHLILPQTKVISDLKFGTLAKYALNPDEIEVQVKSCALNFRDVFAVLKVSRTT